MIASGALTIAGAAPAVSSDSDQSIASGALILTGSSASVEAGSSSVTDSGSLVLVGGAPSVLLDEIRLVASGSLTLVGSMPIVALDLKDVHPGSGALTLNGAAVTLTALEGISWYHMQRQILTRLYNEVVVPNSLESVFEWPNQPVFVPPESDKWARVSIQSTDSRQLTLGASQNLFRARGLLIVRIFDSIEHGTKDILELADLVSEAFRGITVGSLIYRSPYTRRNGRSGKWWSINVYCPFVYTATKVATP